MTREKWLEAAVPCKIGTVPAVVQVHGSDRLVVGKRIRIKRRFNGKWQMVTVNRIDPSGYFQADQ